MAAFCRKDGWLRKNRTGLFADLVAKAYLPKGATPLISFSTYMSITHRYAEAAPKSTTKTTKKGK